MGPKFAKHLEDIRDAVTFVREVTRDRTPEQYRNDRMLRQAVERNLEIIGEAVNRLTRSDPGIAEHITHTAQIVAFRNVLIHGYDLVDDELVWDTIRDDLPRLEGQVEALLRQGAQE